MTGYPPKCPQNGTRKHIIPARADEYNYPAIDGWPGDTAEFPNGNVWRLGRDGTTWTLIKTCASASVAA